MDPRLVSTGKYRKGVRCRIFSLSCPPRRGWNSEGYSWRMEAGVRAFSFPRPDQAANVMKDLLAS